MKISCDRLSVFFVAILTTLSFVVSAHAEDPAVTRGRYLTHLGGCNDCHTPNFAQSGGKVPESDWLTGVPIGWHGPWGTTYASNLRNIVSAMDEKAWIARLRGGQFRPPMPGYMTSLLTEEDIKALYAFIRSLGPKGESMPAGLPPDVIPPGPVVEMIPKVIQPTSPPVPTR